MKTCPKCNEILGDGVDVCFNCNYSFKLKKVLTREEIAEKRTNEDNLRKRQQEIEEENKEIKEKQLNKNPKYEYSAVSIRDDTNGRIDINAIQKMLDLYAEEGWRLHSVFTNELGKNEVALFANGINATIDQTILIFERCIKPGEN